MGTGESITVDFIFQPEPSLGNAVNPIGISLARAVILRSQIVAQVVNRGCAWLKAGSGLEKRDPYRGHLL
jgi:hypothetical protein